jgi:UTP--glucose-1-phosphate uridylyltransferase
VSTRVTVAVVPVAGRGTRLLPLTHAQAKEMFPLGRRPVVQHVADEIAAAGLGRIVFVTSADKAAIQAHFESAAAEQPGGPQAAYVPQSSPRGLGDAVLCAEPAVGAAPFAVALGDCVLTGAREGALLERMLRLFERERPSGVIAFEEVPADEVDKYGVAAPAGDGDVFALRDIVEKPRRQEAPSRLAVAARYVFAPDIFGALRHTPPDARGEVQLTHAVRRLIEGGGRVLGVRLAPGESRRDVGSIDGYFRAFVETALEDAEHGAALRAHLEKLLEKPRP